MNRLEKTRSLLLPNKVSYILITDPVDVEYLSGFRSSNAALLVSRKKTLLFTDFRYKSDAEKFCSRNNIWSFRMVKENLLSAVAGYFPKGSRVGFESNCLTVDELNLLKQHSREVSFVALSSQVSEQFLSKERKEISLMKKAAQAGDKAFEKILGDIKPGVTEIELAKQLENFCSEYGSEKPSFDSIVLFGVRSALPHGRPGKKVLQKGEWVLFDFGCTVSGYCSDMSRTVVMGKANERQKEIYDIVLRAQKEACNAAHSEMTGKELDYKARSIINESGFGEYFGHATGHGVGLRIHEAPRISPVSEKKLEKNTVITIEPGIYIPGSGGVRIEDMLVLGSDKSCTITKSHKELIEL